MTQKLLSTGRFDALGAGRGKLRQLPWLVFLLALSGSWALWRNAEHHAWQAHQLEFDMKVETVVEKIRQRMDDYEQVLYDIRGYVIHTPKYSQLDFADYIGTLQLEQRLPGLQGISYQPLLSGKTGQSAKQSVAGASHARYKSSLPSEQAPVTFIAPPTRANLQLLGQDLLENQQLSAFLTQARDEGRAIMTGKLSAGGAAGSGRQTATMLILPVYRKGGMHEAGSVRHAKLAGWLVASLDMAVLIEGALSGVDDWVDIKLNDSGAPTPDGLAYGSEAASDSAEGKRFQTIIPMHVAGRSWQVRASSRPAFDESLDESTASLTLGMSLLLGMLLTWGTTVLVRDRSHALQMAEGADSALRQNREFQGALRESERRWKLALEAAGHGVWDWNIMEDIVTHSGMSEKITGYIGNEYPSSFESWKGRIHPDDLSKFEAAHTLHISGKTPAINVEYRITQRDKGWRWIITRAMVVERDAQGNAMRMLGTHTDISGRHALQDEITQQKRIAESIIDSLPGNFFMLDGEGKIVRWNKNAEKVTGYNAEELMRLGGLDLVRPEEREGMQQVIQTALEHGEVEVETDLLAKDGRAIPHFFRGVRIDIDGKPHLMGMGLDISARKAAETALRESEERYRETFEDSNFFVFALDTENRVTTLPASLAQALGYEPEEIIGEPFGKVLTEEGWGRLRQCFTDNVNPGNQVVRLEIEMKRSDGSFMPVELAARQKRQGGELVGIRGSGRDITERRVYEQALRDGEEQYRRLFESAGDFAYSTDLSWNFTAVSDTLVEATGMARDELVGSSFAKILTPENLAKTMKMASMKASGERQSTRYEVEATAKGGRQVPVEIVSTLIYKDGKAIGVQGIGRDISERRAMEQALRESEQKYRDLFEFAQEFALTSDLNMNITSVNRMVVDILGYSNGELIDHNIAEFLTPASMEVARSMTEAKLSGESQVTRYGVELHAKDGRLIQAEFSTRLIYSNGAPVGVHAVGYDISERLRYEQALRDSEERYRSIFNNAQDLIFTVDNENRFTSVSDFFCLATGYGRKDILGEHIGKILDAVNLRKAQEMTELKVKGEQEVTRYELDAVCRDGSVITVEMNTSLYFQGGKLAGTLGIARDITARRKMEEELRQSEERTRQIFNNTQDFVFSIDEDNRLTFVTDSFCQIMGYEMDEIIHHHIDKLFTPESLARVRQMIEAKKSGEKKVTRYEVDVVTKDGRVIPIEINSSQIYKNGRSAGSQGTGRDITERRNYEKALRDSEEKYREFFEFANDFAYSMDSEGIFTAANHSLLAATGYENLVGEHISKVLSASDLELARQMTEKKLRGEKAITRYELMLQRRDGGQIPIELVSTLMYRDGKVSGVQGIGRDISERKRAEEMLRRSERNYRELMDQAAEAIFVTDREWKRCEDVNQAACDLLGYTREEMLNIGISRIFHPEEMFEMSGRSGGNNKRDITSVRRRFRRKDGSYIPVEVSSRMLPDGRFQALARDVSQWIERETALKNANLEAESASRAKSEFLANMSHEIRTPMNSVIGMARLAMSREQDPRQVDYLEKILMSGEHLLGIIDDILDFSKIEAGKISIEDAEFDLREMMEGLASLVENKAATKGLKFVMALDPALPPMLRGDPLRLRQVLLNFVDNAIKFTDKGEVRVDARRESSKEAGVTVLFEVADSGIGMNAVELSLLFRPFQQTDGSVTRKYGGTGLGLSICKRLVELMGGEAGVRSAPGKGSLFWFRVRLDEGGQQLARDLEQTVDRRNVQSVIRNMRILLAENNTFNQQVAQEFLEIAGCKVQVANDGVETLALLREGHFDCVLMDVQMPRMDGLEASRQIRSDPAFTTLPIIAVTANALEEERRRCLQAGMNDFITKPLRPEALYAVLAKWLSRQLLPMTMTDRRKYHEPALPVLGVMLDLEVLAELVGGDREQMRQMAGRFVESARQDMAQVNAALEQGDLSQLQALGHHIKSPAAMVGASDFAALCAELELCGDRTHARNLVGRMHDMLKDIEGRVASELG